MSTASASGNRVGARAIRSVALRIAVLFGVLMMHGASTDHVMATPAHHATMASSMEAPPNYTASSPSESGMTHADCVVTVPQQASHTPSHQVLPYSVVNSLVAHLVQVSATSTDVRGPPQPSPIRLCISRT